METEIKSVFKWSQTHSWPSPRPTNWLENTVLSSKRKEHFKKLDLLGAIPQMAVPKEVLVTAQKLAYLTSNTFWQAGGILAVVDSTSFLLQSGEYTKLRKVKRNRKMVREQSKLEFATSDQGSFKVLTIGYNAHHRFRNNENKKPEKWTH